MAGVRMVIEITDANAHMVVQVIRHCNGEADAEDSVGQAENVQVPIFQIKQAGAGSPDERRGGKNRAGDVGNSEQARGNRHRACPRGKPKEPAEKEYLQQELLHERPDQISPDVGEEGRLSVQGVKRTETIRDEDSDGSEEQGCADDPEGGPQISSDQPEGFEILLPQRDDGYDDGAGDPIEDPLQRIRRPDDDQDGGVPQEDLNQIAAPPGNCGYAPDRS